MQKIYEQLKQRFDIMAKLSREICVLEVSKKLCDKFFSIVGKAMKLNSKLINAHHWDSESKYDISIYLLECESCIEQLGKELPRYHCKMRSLKKLFSEERQLITSFL